MPLHWKECGSWSSGSFSLQHLSRRRCADPKDAAARLTTLLPLPNSGELLSATLSAALAGPLLRCRRPAQRRHSFKVSGAAFRREVAQISANVAAISKTDPGPGADTF